MKPVRKVTVDLAAVGAVAVVLAVNAGPIATNLKNIRTRLRGVNDVEVTKSVSGCFRGVENPAALEACAPTIYSWLASLKMLVSY
jgi:hypothetical protein